MRQRRIASKGGSAERGAVWASRRRPRCGGKSRLKHGNSKKWRRMAGKGARHLLKEPVQRRGDDGLPARTGVAVVGTPRNPRRRPRRGGSSGSKMSFMGSAARGGMGSAARGACGRAAGGTMCTVPSRFECVDLSRSPTTGCGAPAICERVPMAGRLFWDLFWSDPIP